MTKDLHFARRRSTLGAGRVPGILRELAARRWTCATLVAGQVTSINQWLGQFVFRARNMSFDGASLVLENAWLKKKNRLPHRVSLFAELAALHHRYCDEPSMGTDCRLDADSIRGHSNPAAAP